MSGRNEEQSPSAILAETAPGSVDFGERASVVTRGVALENRSALIHVRFRPDGTVWEIAERPAGLSGEEWFKRLCARVGDRFQARCGGRGMFRISGDELEALKASQTH
ncbi:hypothetical protein ACNHKD_08185 [Methylocystis sp. JAN1]|uniref:hypothetical protein n=1 Tax=Methylocystis sp. JAN1 TaxID=3397211 RepID=UPI003FA1E3A8